MAIVNQNILEQGYQNALQSPDYYKGLWTTTPSGSNGGSNWFQNLGGWKGVGGTAAALGTTIGNARYGVYDYADPTYWMADGRESAVGNTMNGVGVGLFQAGVQSGNPMLMAIGGGAKAIGGLWNSAFGKKWNKDNIAKLDSTIAGMNSTAKGLASADNNNSLISNWNSAPQAFSFNKSYIGKDGWFTHGVGRKFDNYQKQMADAGASMMHGLNTGVENIEKRNRGTIYNSSAFGGPLDTGMSAVDFNFMSDWLASKRDKAAGSGRAGFAGYPGLFAYGGGMHNHGADWSNGSTHIDAGGSHEENPNEGVQIGTDREGVPNLVEEGEVIYNDYVYSNRIKMDNAAKERFHINRKRDITYAEMAKKLEKESEERPNDPISKRSLDTQMAQLAEEQERQKQEQKAAEAQQMFASLSPDEQVGLMQQVQAEEQAAAEQQMAEQQAMQQGVQGMPVQTPMDATAMQGIPMEQPVAEAPMIGAYGGKLFEGGGSLVNGADVNTFPIGGWLKEQWNNWKNRDKMRTLKQYNEDWFLNQARALGMIGEKDNEIKIKVNGDNGTEEERTFSFDDEDAVANLENFNHLFRMYQRQKALDTYIAGQRQAKLNELLGPNGMYRKSDDGRYYQRATINPADRTIYINRDYDGTNGFITPEAYTALSDEDKALYRKRIERAGDRLYDYNDVPVWTTVEGATEDSILEPYINDFSNGFKWNINDSQSLDYPAELRHSTLSGLRYAPAVGGALGLLYNIAKKPDYSRAQEIKDYALGINPMMISAEYNPIYRTYRPMDPWRQENILIAASNGTGRAVGNVNSPSRGAMQIANGYNLINGLGNMGVQGLMYNDNLAGQVATHNSGENKTLAQLGLQAQAYNQYGVNNAQRMQYEGLVRGNAMMDDIDARRNAAVNANLTNLMTSLGNIGEEAYDMDRLKYLINRGVLRSAYGGKVNRKKNR